MDLTHEHKKRVTKYSISTNVGPNWRSGSLDRIQHLLLIAAAEPAFAKVSLA